MICDMKYLISAVWGCEIQRRRHVMKLDLNAVVFVLSR